MVDPKPRKKTSPGLGTSSVPPRKPSRPPSASPRPPSGAPIPRTTGAFASAESTTGMRKKRVSIKEDDVGAGAVKLAGAGARTAAPRLLANRKDLVQAPIDHRAAFILTFVDGASPIDSIVDAAGMPEAEVTAILQRLARLGLIALP